MKPFPYIFRIILSIIPSKLFISFRYFLCYRKFPNINTGKTFDEKMLKYILYYRDDRMKILADKFTARKYISDKGFGNTLNEVYGVYDNFDEIDFEALPEQFVLKTNHACGFNLVVRDKSQLDLKKARKLFNHWMRMNFYYYAREWVYKDIKRKIICEKYLINEEYGELVDYKISCYHGKVRTIYAMYDRYSKDGWLLEPYDPEWNLLDYDNNTVFMYIGDRNIPKPECLDEMITFAEYISKDFPFVRMDVYSVDNKVIFGEATFFPSGGLTVRCDCRANDEFGSWINLNIEK